MSSNKKIAISGKSGCGNSTISRMVAEALDFELVNYTFKNIAREKSMGFDEFCQLAEKDDYWDKYLDKKQVKMTEGKNAVLGSRLAIWMLKQADLKVYLDASLEVRAKRILKREGGNFQEILEHTKDRDQRDAKRYQKLYDIDIEKYDFADIIINTEKLNPDQITQIIVKRFKETF